MTKQLGHLANLCEIQLKRKDQIPSLRDPNNKYLYINNFQAKNCINGAKKFLQNNRTFSRPSQHAPLLLDTTQYILYRANFKVALKRNET